MQHIFQNNNHFFICWALTMQLDKTYSKVNTFYTKQEVTYADGQIYLTCGIRICSNIWDHPCLRTQKILWFTLQHTIPSPITNAYIKNFGTSCVCSIRNEWRISTVTILWCHQFTVIAKSLQSVQSHYMLLTKRTSSSNKINLKSYSLYNSINFIYGQHCKLNRLIWPPKKHKKSRCSYPVSPRPCRKMT